MVDLLKKLGGFSYHYTGDQIREFQKLSYAQRLEWVIKTNNFLQKFMPLESKLTWEKLRRGE
ncbi:MAG: hypothetical protein FD145_1123 [Candidatus Saganbacteria bacterium]|uniref:Uncharacterized protein n=1 Tax=Candidatus Saganbacteria bacterium TaxID=2575572 RepID=A0A833L0G7_UNCSA|nr:MAG: hypothetical protein FD145_1123 [Candidatus Saganbacteria bacterium]